MASPQIVAGRCFSPFFMTYLFIFPLQGTLGFICLSRCDRAEPPAAGALGGAAAPAARGEPSGEEDIERGITHLQQAPSRPPFRSPYCDPQSSTIFHYLPLSSTISHYLPVSSSIFQYLPLSSTTRSHSGTVGGRVGGTGGGVGETEACFAQARGVFTRKDHPLRWAATNLHLAEAYAARVQGEPRRNVEQAIEHCRFCCALSSLGGQPRCVLGLGKRGLGFTECVSARRQ